MGVFDELIDDNQDSPVVQQEESTVTGMPFAEERGFAMDTASSLGRGVLSLAGLGAKAFETLTPYETGLDEWAEKTRENVDFFKPDESEYFEEKGFIGKGWQGAMESLVPSMAGFAPGAAAGAALGSAFGGIGAVPGAAIGGILSTLGLFGAGTYGEAKEAALANGLDEDQAHSYALKQGLIEGGVEGVASGIEAYTAGLGKLFTRPLAKTLKTMLSTSGKDVAKAYAKTMATETGTEMFQSGAGAAVDQAYGMGDTSISEAAIDSIMPSLFMSGIFTLGGQGYNARQKTRMLKALQSGDVSAQTNAVKALKENLNKYGEPELAEGLDTYAKANIGKPFDVNINLIDMMEEIRTNEAEAAERADVSGDPDALTGWVNGKLIAPVPYEAPGSYDTPLDLEDEESIKRFEQMSLRQRRKAAGIEEFPHDPTAVLEKGVPTVEQVSEEEAKEQEKATKLYTGQAAGTMGKGTPDLSEEYRGYLKEMGVPDVDYMTNAEVLKYENRVKEYLQSKKPEMPKKRRGEVTGTPDLQSTYAELGEEKATVKTPVSPATVETITEPKEKQLAAKVRAEQKARQEAEVKAAEEKQRAAVAGQGAPDITDAYSSIGSEWENIATTKADEVKTRVEIRKTLDELEAGGLIAPAEREIMEDAYFRENDGVEKTPEQLKIIQRIARTQEAGYTASGAYVTPEGSEVQEEVQEPVTEEAEATPEATPVVLEGETKYDDEGMAVNAIAGVEDSLIAAEEAAEAEAKAVEERSLLSPESEEKITDDMSETTVNFLKGDVAAIKTAVNKLAKELPTSQKKAFDEAIKGGDVEAASVVVEEEVSRVTDEAKAEALSKDMQYFRDNFSKMDEEQKDLWRKKIGKSLPKGEGRAKAFDQIAEEANREATIAGMGAEFNEALDHIRKEATYVSSSRRKTDVKVGQIKWSDITPTMKAGSDETGRQYILNTEDMTLTVQDKNGEWETMEGSSYQNLIGKANAVAKKGILAASKAEDLTAYKPRTDTDVVGGVTEEAEEGVEGPRLSDEEVESDQLMDLALPEGEQSDTVENLLENGTRDTDAYEILQDLKKNRADLTGTQQAALGFLLKFVPEEKLRDIAVRPGTSAPAEQQRDNSFWMTDDHAVYYGRGATNRTLLHEIVHGVTVSELRQLAEDHPLKVRLKSLWDSYNGFLEGEELTTRQNYALFGNDKTKTKRNLYEFLSMAVTEPEIQADLRAIPVPKGKRTTTIRNLWDQIVDLVRRAFKLPKSYHSALEDLLGVTADLSNMPLARQLAGQNPKVAELMGAMDMSRREAIDTVNAMGGFEIGVATEDVQEDFQATKEFLKEKKAAEEKGETWWSKGLKAWDHYTQPISETVRKISPRAHSLLVKMEQQQNERNTKAHKEIKGFVDKYNKLDEDDKYTVGYLILNSNNDKERKELEKYFKDKGLYNDWTKVQKVLKDIHGEYDRVGLNVFNKIPGWYPRRVKDVKGLSAHLRKINEKGEGNLGPFAEVFESGLSAKQQEERIADILNTGFNPATALKIPSSVKSRSIQKVTPSMMQFYHNPVDSLIDTIYEANEAIVTRDFIGVDKSKGAVDKINKLYSQLEKADGAKAQKILERIELLKKEAADVEQISDDSISRFIREHSENLDAEQQEQLLVALRARLNQKGMSGGWAKVRDLGLITALGSPLNAVTQLGDLVWSIYENGPVNTIKAIFGDKEVTTKDLDMSHVLKEFSQGSTAKWVDKTLKWTGFDWVDQFGKNVNMQAAINKARNSSQEQFVKKWEGQLTPETASKVWEDIQKGEISEDVRHFVFSSVSKFQPVSLSEMPAQYLQSGNGRIFYSLKSYGIKALSNIRREIIEKYQSGDVKGASKSLTTLLPLLVLANASVDEIKDFILGREEPFSDKVWDNLLKLGFASRYTLDRGFRSGSPVKTFLQDVLTPPGTYSIADPFLKDLVNLVNDEEDNTYSLLKQVPVAGKLLYNYSPEGQVKNLDSQRRSIYKAIRESVTDDNYSEVRRRINKFNREARKTEGIDTISNKTIRSIKSKERKRLANKRKE